MQIFKFLFFSLVVALFFLATQLTTVPYYDLSIERTYITDNNLHLSGSLYTLNTLHPKNIWYLGIKKSALEHSSTQDICVRWQGNAKTTEECLDQEGDDVSEEYYTFPTSIGQSNTIRFSFIGDVTVSPEDIVVYSMNTAPAWNTLAWRMHEVSADPSIITRAQWGADESLRYVDSAKQKPIYDAYLKYLARPKTQTELNAIQRSEDVDKIILSKWGDTTQIMSVARYENGRQLAWPIQKVKRVDRIVIHHTAESLDRQLSDEEMLRAIYAYHAVSRGWWDIGYNYIVGQRGKIYEGRAGGDYVIGAHALYNNMGTVGVSVIGNYETLHLNAEQLAGLKDIISTLARKYGITLSDSATGFRVCSAASCSGPLTWLSTQSLIGHRDVGVTSCPGKNIYDLIPDLIRELDRPYTPVLNTASGPYDAKPENEKMNLTPQTATTLKSATTLTTPTNSTKNTTNTTSTTITTPQSSTTTLTVSTGAIRTKVSPARYIGKKFRVRLSYPKDQNSITLASYDGSVANAYLDYRRKPIYPGTPMEIRAEGNDRIALNIAGTSYSLATFSFSAPAVEITSWTRRPDWDTSWRYNDNVFRDTIEILNENGSLVVVNHLPLEWYLKGLGEVSNGDLPEKIKTIVVAARGYASYYMDPKNRKYNTNRYDGSDDPESFQKYLGYSYELRSPNVAALVDATQNEKIYYNDVLIKPWYFSRSNGRTLSYQEYCTKNGSQNCENIPYLQSVDDPAGKNLTQWGHGVGISGVGATYFATQGWDYKKIIQYYLTGVEVRP